MTSPPPLSGSSNESRRPTAAYFHVPFCAHRCGYCDFTLIAGRDDLVGDYLRSLEREIEISAIPLGTPLETSFFGGGTPTHPKPAEMRRMFEMTRRYFQVSAATEFSVEANPLDLTDEKIDLLAEMGVNRISLGVQSFSKQALTLLERDHCADDVRDVMTRLRTRFENISVDLIFGVPNQSLSDWSESLRQAIELCPTHISTYGLTFEKGTAFWTRLNRGDISDEELEREQYAIAMEQLPAAGFAQYEISNFAKPGFECRHNKVYWNGDEYWAFGPGAARYLNGRRETNIRSVLGWLARLERGESPVADSEELEREHRARELIYLGLRRIHGLDRKSFHEKTGFELDELCGPALKTQVKLGLLDDDGVRVCLTLEGRFVADRVVQEFL